MMENEDILIKLRSILVDIFDFYDIDQTKVDTNINAEESWPIGADIYVVCGITKSKIYVQRLYIEKGATNAIINSQIQNLMERFYQDLSIAQLH